MIDFNEMSYDPVPISKTDDVIDSDGNVITLAEGMRVHLYDPDMDWYDREDALLADGTATRMLNPYTGVPMWGCCVDERGVYHESDSPDYVMAPLTAAEMREYMYKEIEQTIANVPEPDRWSIKLMMTMVVAELRKIDRDEGTELTP